MIYFFLYMIFKPGWVRVYQRVDLKQLIEQMQELI